MTTTVELRHDNTSRGLLSTLRVSFPDSYQVRHSAEYGRHAKEYLIDKMKREKALYILNGWQYNEYDIRVLSL